MALQVPSHWREKFKLELQAVQVQLEVVNLNHGMAYSALGLGDSGSSDEAAIAVSLSWRR